MSVYFIQSGAYIKIGYSANPVKRAQTVTRNGIRPADVPFDAPARLIGWIPGDMQREMALLVRFADSRVAGEWFYLDIDEVREIIWADPHSVDLDRMSALSVFAAIANPDLTHGYMAAAGVPIEAPAAPLVLAERVA